jgi:predicted membrane GTPase involved in stress response
MHRGESFMRGKKTEGRKTCDRLFNLMAKDVQKRVADPKDKKNLKCNGTGNLFLVLNSCRYTVELAAVLIRTKS